MPHPRLLRQLLLLALALAVLPVAALAQTGQTGVIQGRVTGATGAPVAGAAVRSAQADGSYPRTATTGADGVFRIAFLPPGRYDVVVARVGMGETRLAGVSVRAGEIAELAPVLREAALALEGIAVVAERPLIDPATTEVTTELNAEQIALLPASRTATDLIKFTPGARPDAVWGGSSSQANSYVLDGVSVNQPGYGGDFLLPNVDWIESISVQGLGAGAEYGNFQGGLINIVTKQGTNTLQGGVRVGYEDVELNASNLDLGEAGEQMRRRWEVNAEARGPILRDRLYYYVSAQELRRDTRVVDLLASDPGEPSFLPTEVEREERKLLAKLTWQATSRDVFNLMGGKDDVSTDNLGLTSFDTPETSYSQRSPSFFYNLSWQRTWNPSNLLEVKVTGYDAEDIRNPRFRDLPAVRILGGNSEQYQNAVYQRDYLPTSRGVAAQWDSYLRTGSVRHHLKVGGDYTMGWWEERRTRNAGFTWRPERADGVDFDPQDPATWGFISSDWGGDINLDTRTVNAAVYVQDYIDVGSRLRINPGLRVGHWRGYITPGDGEGDEFRALSATGLDPRLGVVLDLTGEGKWVAKGHWGRFHQSLFAAMFDRVPGGNVFADTEYWDWTGPGLPDPTRAYTTTERDQLFEFFDSEPNGSEVGPIEDYEQPYVDQWTVGLERALGARWKAEVVYVNRRNRNILALIDRNQASNFTAFQGVSVVDPDSGDPILDARGQPLVLPTVYVSNADIKRRGSAPGMTPEQVAALTYEEDFALTNVDDATRRFDQLQLALSGSLADWQVRGSVVWTDLRGNFFSVSGYDGTLEGAGPYVNLNERTNSDGRLGNFSDWEGKLQLSGSLPWRVRAGAYFAYLSGDRFTPTYSIDNRNHDFVAASGQTFNFRLFNGVSGENVFLEERGSRTLPSRSVMDLHLERGFRVGRGEWVLGVDAFNLFNTGAVTSRKTFVNDVDPTDPTTAFGAVRERVVPRTLRLTTSLRF